MNFKHTIEYGFWFWSHKLEGLMTILAGLIDYELSDGELEAIQSLLVGTNDEKGKWMDWRFEGEKNELKLRMANDTEEGEDMIHIQITAQKSLLPKLEALDFIQSSLQEFKLMK